MTKDFKAAREMKNAVAAFKRLLDADDREWSYTHDDTRDIYQRLKFVEPSTDEKIGAVTVYVGEKNAKPGEWRREPAVFFQVAGRHVEGGRRGYFSDTRETSKIDVALKHVQNYFRPDNNEELYQEARRKETAASRRAIQVADKKLRMLADGNAVALARLAVFGESGVIAHRLAVEERWMVLKDLDADDHYPDMTPGDVATFRRQYRRVSEAHEEATRTLAEVEEAVNERFGVV